MTSDELDEIKQTIKSAIEETKKVTSTDEALKAQYQQYYKDRDAQLSKFWESSKYVWTFLAVVFGGYGVALFKFLELDDTDKETNYLLILLGLCFLGIVLSLVWIHITRGSKAWYEVFEVAIWSMENSFGLPFDTSFRQRFVPKEYDKDENQLHQIRQFNIDKFMELKDNSWISSGPFSASKINILLGWILLIVWSILFVVHASEVSFSFEMIHIEKVIWIIPILTIVICVIYFIVGKTVKSSSLDTGEKSLERRLKIIEAELAVLQEEIKK